MGTWIFEGGRFWNGSQLENNDRQQIAVNNAEDRIFELASDDLILPGMIDSNVMAFEIEADKHKFLMWEDMINMGLCGAIDGGNYGYEAWQRADRIWKWSPVEMRSWINIMPMAGIYNPPQRAYVEEIDKERLIETFKQANGRALGFKVDLGYYGPDEDREWLELAREVADICGTRIMVQSAEGALSLDGILEYMKAGDVLTGCYHNYPETSIVNDDGIVRPEVLEAIEKGVLLDTQVTKLYLDFTVFKKALAAGLKPDFISTGMTQPLYHSGLVKDTAYIFSKFITLGLPLEDALNAVTTNPAKLMGISLDAAENILVLQKHTKEEVFRGNSYYIGADPDNTVVGDGFYEAALFVRKNNFGFCDLKGGKN